MIPIITWTLWRKRWYILWWTLGLAAYMALVIIAYPPFRDQAATLNDSLNQLPGTVKSLVADTSDFLSPIGYMSSNAYYIMLPIIFGIMAIGLGSSLVASEEADHTLELILSRPVSRGKLLAGRAVSGVAILFVVATITALVTVILAALIDLNIGLWNLAYTTYVSMLLALLFGALTFTFAAFGSVVRAASIGVATLLLIAGYLFTSLSGTVEWLKWPAKVLPYNYYHPANILGGAYHWADTLGMIVVIVVLGMLSYVGFRRRDIS